MSLLRWIASSRARLASAAFLAYALLLGAAAPLAAHIRDHSDSVVQDTALLTFWLLSLLIGATCLAILIGDMAFGSAWRLRFILGVEPAPTETSDDALLAASALPRNHRVAFSAILVGLVAVGGWSLEVVTDDFLEDYQRVGHKRSILRGDNDELKFDLIKDLSRVRRESYVRDAVSLLDLTWRDERQPTAVREAALATLGRLGFSLVSSMDSWVKQGIMDHWEIDLVRDIRRQIAPDLLVLTGQSSPGLAAGAWIALGKIRHTASVPFLITRVLDRTAPGSPTWIAAAVGLGLGHDETALEPLTMALAASMLPDDDPFWQRPYVPATSDSALASRLAELHRRHGTPLLTVEEMMALTYALGEVARKYLPGSDPKLDDFFETLTHVVGTLARSGGPGGETLAPDIVRCLTTDILRKTGDARIAPALFDVFDGPGGEAACEAAHVDIAELAPELFVRTEPLRLRALRALALVAVGNDEVLDWTRARLEKGGYGEFIETQLRNVLAMVEHREASP